MRARADVHAGMRACVRAGGQACARECVCVHACDHRRRTRSLHAQRSQFLQRPQGDEDAVEDHDSHSSFRTARLLEA